MNRLETCFVANAAVLCVHQIDAAYWHEWELFHLPGGNQLNLILNLPILASVFIAFWHVVRRTRFWRLAYGYLAFLGGLTFVIHAGFFLLGYPQFLQWMSVMLILASACLSLLQVYLLRQS